MNDFLLDSDELPERKLYDADKGKRLLNLIIDQLLYFISFYTMAFILGLMLGFAGLYSEELLAELEVWFTVFALIWIVLYYWLSEWIFKGRTPAKFLTGTRAVTKDGLYLSPGQALGRSLGRLIPFDAFSYLFGDRGLHDMVSNTRVVDWPRNWK